MPKVAHTPDPEVKVHPEGVIRLLCSAFQSHEAGLPEWVKNSSDAYAREDAPEEKRVIVLIFDHNRKHRFSSISCLDFSGMTTDAIEKNFRHWGSPDAAGADDPSIGVQGGHGNGGKCYMVQMFDQYAIVRTAKRGRANRYGIPAGSQRFGYMPSPREARNYKIADLEEELADALAVIGCRMSSLPDEAMQAFSMADGFTLVTGMGPKGYDQRIPVQAFIRDLQDHPQMIRSLELCSIYVVVNGRLLSDAAPLRLRDIESLDQSADPRVIAVPRELSDPLSDALIRNAEEDHPAGTLTLRTSSVSMRWKKKFRHNVIYRAGRAGAIGYVPVTELDIQSPYRDNIYGEIELESLHSYKQNDRSRLAASPLTRSVDQFIAAEIERYAKEFEARDRRRRAHDERDAVSRMNAALDRWKNRFLNELMAGLWGEGEGSGDTGGDRLPSGTPGRMELRLTYGRAGVGVAIRPTLKIFDRTGRQIRSVPHRWVSEDTNVAWVDEDLGVINTFALGETAIYAETIDGKLRSNVQNLHVIRVHSIAIEPDQVELPAGSRARLKAMCHLPDGAATSDVYLVWTEADSAIARVSPSGLVFGFNPGATEITAGDDHSMAAPSIVTVVHGDGKDKGEKKGRGYPLILVSGDFDRDPDTNEEVNFSSEAPPVAQRPQDVDRNIWWINSAAPFAQLYLDKSRGFGYDTREWRAYHLERMIEVIVQIAITHGPNEEDELSAKDWIVEWGNKAAEIQAAAASDLLGFITDGQLPAE